MKKTEAGGIIFYIKDRITISNPHTKVLSEDKRKCRSHGNNNSDSSHTELAHPPD
jgi:hypothetical protein